MNKDLLNFKVSPNGKSAFNEKLAFNSIEKARPAEPGEIPIIDIACLYTRDKHDMQDTAKKIRMACERIGFFYIVNHGIPKKVVESVFREAKLFFSQSEKFKQRLLFNNISRGYKGPGNIAIPGYKPDLKEVLDLGVDLAKDHPDVIAKKPLQGPNQWPPLPGFKETLTTYYQEVSNVGHQMLRLFALALNLDEGFFLPFHKTPMITWRIMRYFPHKDIPGQYGTAPHTDFGTITLLAQDEKGGLEVYSRDNEWIKAPHVTDSLVVNIGDLMACWTNNQFTSTAHRVLNLSGQDRYSIPMFYNPGFDTVAQCLPSCRSETNPPQYEPIHYGEYVSRIYERIFSGQQVKK